jgi:hypothetical protein
MSSWPTLFAAAFAIWLVLRGPAAKTPAWAQKFCRVAIAFCVYTAFLYLLKWNPFWAWVPLADSENRNKVEGFLILISTLIWLIATLRILLRGLRFPSVHAGSSGFESRGRKEEGLWHSIKTLAIFYYFVTRK